MCTRSGSTIYIFMHTSTQTHSHAAHAHTLHVQHMFARTAKSAEVVDGTKENVDCNTPNRAHALSKAWRERACKRNAEREA